MIASAPLPNSGGASAVDGESGFGDLISAFLSARLDPAGPTGPDAPSGDGPAPVEAETKSPDLAPLVLPGPVAAKQPEPQVLPGPVAKDADPLVLPEAGGDPAKEPEPQVRPEAKPAADAGPVVLPDVQAKAEQPQVLPGPVPDKAVEPQVLPGPVPGKGAAPQVLPGTASDRAAAPQVLPAQAADAIAPAPVAEKGTPVAAEGPETVVPQAAGPRQEAAAHTPPPLRPLAERTSKPLEDGSPAAAPSSSSAGEKAAAPAAPATAPAEAPAKPAAPQGRPEAAAQPETDAPTLEDARPSGGPTTAPQEGSGPVRTPGVPTLSQATIDATAQIAAQILRKLEGRSTRFEIALRPDELGRVDVKLDIDSEGRLAARLAFDNPAAAADLRGRADELRRQLEAAGFQLADDALEFAERDSGSSAFDRGHDARQNQGRAFAAAARLNAETEVGQPPQWRTLSLSPSGVDMKV